MKKNTANLQDRKARLADFLQSIEDEAFLAELERLIGALRSKSEGTRPKLTKAMIESHLDESERDAEEGRLIPVEDLMAEVKKWG